MRARLATRMYRKFLTPNTGKRWRLTCTFFRPPASGHTNFVQHDHQMTLIGLPSSVTQPICCGSRLPSTLCKPPVTHPKRAYPSSPSSLMKNPPSHSTRPAQSVFRMLSSQPSPPSKLCSMTGPQASPS